MLLEAQLEKQLESISFTQSCAEEVEQVRLNVLQHSHLPQEGLYAYNNLFCFVF